jgi:beta-galactosidase
VKPDGWSNTPGQYLCTRLYRSFSYDRKPHLNFGARDNLIAVRTDNSHQPNSRWSTGSGAAGAVNCLR